jgi:SAM-dependent methyltransferase
LSDYTTPEYWDRFWDGAKVKHIKEQRINNQIIKIIKTVLFKNSKILEIGCVPAARLYFLQKYFLVDTYGLDYSLQGLLSSVKSKNHLVCSDLYHPPFKQESFDLVYSLGVIEHFKSPCEIIAKHIDLVKKGGLILITVPNFYRFSLLSTVFRILGYYKGVKQTHNMEIMNINAFKRLFEKISVQILISDYYGPLGILSPSNPAIRRLCTRINVFIDKGSIRSKLISPDMVFVGKKI